MSSALALKRSVRDGILVTTLFFASLSCLMAGTDEDFAAGERSYRAGDIVGAMTPLRNAANAGHPKAQVLLAEILDRSEFDEEAIALYRKAADQGDADGMFGLGVMLAAGEGIKKKEPLDGRKWIEKVAGLGHKQAVNVMAQAHLNLDLAITESERESEQALLWMKKAAANDYLPAIDALIAAYSIGNRWGLAVDPVLASQYRAQASQLRDAEPAKTKKKLKRVG
jgi:TPR repeat protein